MNCQHKELASGKWAQMSLAEQMANIGSEVERAISWRNKNNSEYSQQAFERALELIDLSLADKKNKNYLKEVARVREGLVDYFLFDNSFSSTDEAWQEYFYAFNFVARKNI